MPGLLLFSPHIFLSCQIFTDNLNAHGGGTVLPDGSAGFNDLSEFLDLLDQASE